MTNTTLAPQPFRNIREELIQMEYALKHGKMLKEQARLDAIKLAKELEDEVRGTTLVFEVPEKEVDKHHVATALVNIAKKGKSMLIVALQDLGTALKQKRDELALRIIGRIKRNDMYQKDSKQVESWWLSGLRPFENKKKLEVK